MSCRKPRSVSWISGWLTAAAGMLGPSTPTTCVLATHGVAWTPARYECWEPAAKVPRHHGLCLANHFSSTAGVSLPSARVPQACPSAQKAHPVFSAAHRSRFWMIHALPIQDHCADTKGGLHRHPPCSQLRFLRLQHLSKAFLYHEYSCGRGCKRETGL